jgi:hypothetical protein
MHQRSFFLAQAMSQAQASQAQASEASDMSQGQARQFQFDRRLEAQAASSACQAVNDFHRAAAGLEAHDTPSEFTSSIAEALRRGLAQMLADDVRHGVKRQCLSCEGDERCISCANLYGVQLDLGPDYVPEESPGEDRQYSRDSEASQQSEPLGAAQCADHCYAETDDCDFGTEGGARRVSNSEASQSATLEVGQNSVVEATRSSAVKTIETTSRVSFGAWRQALNFRERREYWVGKLATPSHASVPTDVGGVAVHVGGTLLEVSARKAAQSSANEAAQSVELVDSPEADSQQILLRDEVWKRARIADEAEAEF